MATSYTRNLSLRVDSSLSADAKFNLNKIDTLGGVLLTDSAENISLKSAADVVIEPQSADVGGTGLAGDGNVSIGTTTHTIGTLTSYATIINLKSPVGLVDSAVGGTKYLRITYNSATSGVVDTTADRVLTLDLQDADRSVVLGGGLSTAGGDLTLTMSAATSLVLPTTGTVATLAGAEVLTGKVSLGFLQGGWTTVIRPAQSGQSANIQLTLPPTPGTLGQLLATDGSGNLSWTSAGGGTVRQFSGSWLVSDGATKLLTHSLATSVVDVTVLDDTGEIVYVDSISVTNSNAITLVSSEVPAATWTVLVQAN